MGKIESTIKSEIQRLAKHEVRTVFRPLRKEVWGIRLKLSNLLKGFAPLNRWAKETAQSKSKEAEIGGFPGGSESLSFHPGKDSRPENETWAIPERTGDSGRCDPWRSSFMGKGEISAQGEKKAALVGLRKVRKRDVKKMLMENAEPEMKEEIFKKKKANIKKNK